MVRVRYSFGSRHTGNLKNIKRQRSKYPEVMRKVMEMSDIILQVLDSRFITETRNYDVEQDLRIKGKNVIFVLNKCDLVDLRAIERELSREVRPYVFISSKEGKGSRELRKRIGIEAKKVKRDDGERITVGVVGYPNVGKSSVINLITKKGAAKTSKQAGFTKGMQKIKMNEEIVVLDTPGVIPGVRYSNQSRHEMKKDAKLGARDYSNVKDPEDIVHFLMTPPSPKNIDLPTQRELEKIEEVENQAKAIEEFYEIESNGDSEELIEELGRKKNFLKKGAKVDVDRTARIILRDWQEGKIRIK